MTSFKIFWSDSAIYDLELISDFLSKDDSFDKFEILKNIFNSVENIIPFPKRGRIIIELADDSFREVFSDSYRIIYEIIESRIEIILIVHMKMDFNLKIADFKKNY